MSPAVLLLTVVASAPQAELLDFTAVWCKPCQEMKPIVERLHREGYPVRQVDYDTNKALAQQYRVDAIPTFILVVDGKEVARLVGGQSEGRIREMLKLLPRSEGASQADSTETAGQTKPWLPKFLNGKQETATAENANPRSIARGQSPDPPQAAAPSGSGAPEAARNPLQTAARIRVEDAQGIDYGSGTVIGSKEGQALILTCWHIFRGANENDAIQVDLFPNGPEGKPVTYEGRFIRGDEKADVALVGITGCGMMPVSPIAGADQFPAADEVVSSVGCDEGKPVPTRLQHRVTRLNPFDGPGTTECTGEPAVGRSGGGLFNAAGRIIGVCFAAERDSENPRGFYVAPNEIHELLNDANFAALIPKSRDAVISETGKTEEGGVAAVAENVFAGEAGETVPAESGESMPHGEENGSNPFAAGGMAEVAATDGHQHEETISPIDSAGAATVLEELADGELEATIVLRSRENPNLPSRVVVINQVSDRFRRYLTGEVSEHPQETSLRTPTRGRQPHIPHLTRVFAIHR